MKTFLKLTATFCPPIIAKVEIVAPVDLKQTLFAVALLKTVEKFLIIY